MIAYLQFGGSAYWSPQFDAAGKERPLPTHAPGMNRSILVYGGWSEAAQKLGPQLRAKGITRVHVQNPGGHWPLWPWTDTDLADWRQPFSVQQNTHRAQTMGLVPIYMHRNQWLLAEQAGCQWADRRELRIFHDTLIADFGVTEVIYYLGGSESLKRLPDNPRLALSKLSLEPFIGLDGASFGFDYVVSPAHFEMDEAFYKWIKQQNPGSRIYTEGLPLVEVDAKRFAKLTDGAISANLSAAWEEQRLAHYRKHWQGEVIAVVASADDAAGHTPLARNWHGQ